MIDSYTIGAKFPMLVKIEIDLIKRYVNELPPNPIIINIGAGVGAGSLAMLEERDDLLIWSIDNLFPDTGMYEPGEKQNLINAGFWDSGSVIQVRGESQLVGKKWNVLCDMLFIDGDHRYSFVKKDIELWVPWAKPGAPILFHDYATKKVKPKAGVKQAVDELLSHYKPIDYRKWLWVIRKSST